MKMEEKEATIAIEEESHKDIVEESGFNPLSCLLGTICFPFIVCPSIYSLQEREQAVILRWGKYEQTVRDPGLHWSNSCGRNLVRVMTTKKSLELPNMKVADLNGNPLVVSGVVTWFVEAPSKYTLNVENAPNFLLNLATGVLKGLVSRYPYESSKGMCLKTEGDKIGMEFVMDLQKKVAVAGIKVVGFQMNEISYAPEIAALMLKKQQAGALMEARQIMVKGAVDIAYTATSELGSKGINMDNAQRVHLVTNLLTVLTSETTAIPTVPMNP